MIIDFAIYFVCDGVIKVNNNPDGLPQDFASGRNETDLQLLSHTYDEERSLGLGGINWVLNFLIKV